MENRLHSHEEPIRFPTKRVTMLEIFTLVLTVLSTFFCASLIQCISLAVNTEDDIFVIAFEFPDFVHYTVLQWFLQICWWLGTILWAVLYIALEE